MLAAGDDRAQASACTASGSVLPAHQARSWKPRVPAESGYPDGAQPLLPELRRPANVLWSPQRSRRIRHTAAGRRRAAILVALARDQQ